MSTAAGLKDRPPSPGHADDASRSGDSRRAWLCLAAVVLGALAVLGHEARGLTFNADDWQYVLDARPLSPHVLLEPHLQHLSALPILAYRVLRGLFGIASYWPYMGLLLAVHATACILLYALCRRYIGPWMALAPAAVLAVLGPAWNDLLWAFQVAYIGAVAAGLGMLLALERRDGRGDALAAALLVTAVFTSSDGLGMLVLAAVLIVLTRPRRWTRLWIPGLALALYLAWYVGYGVSDVNWHNLGRVPGYVVQAIAAAFAAVTGVGFAHRSPFEISTALGGAIALATLAIFGVGLRRGYRPAPLAIAAAVSALTLWVAAALAYIPSREADQSRFQYYSAVLILVALAAAMPAWRPGRRAALTLTAATAAILASNLVILDHRAGFWRQNSAYTAAEAGALEAARGVVPADYAPLSLFQAGLTGRNGLESVVAGPYFAAVDRYGSPADTSARIQGRPEAVREAADLILQGSEGIGLASARTLRGRCMTAGSGSVLPELTLSPGTIVAVKVAPGTAAQLQLRRFAARYRFVAFGDVPPRFHVPILAAGAPLSLHLPRDSVALPWHARVLGGRRVTVCAAST